MNKLIYYIYDSDGVLSVIRGVETHILNENCVLFLRNSEHQLKACFIKPIRFMIYNEDDAPAVEPDVVIWPEVN